MNRLEITRLVRLEYSVWEHSMPSLELESDAPQEDRHFSTVAHTTDIDPVQAKQIIEFLQQYLEAVDAWQARSQP